MSSPTHVEREHTIDVAVDPRLSRGVKAFLQVLNASGGPPLETLPPLEARAVLANAQASVPVDLSGIEESEKIINADGYTIPLNIVRPAGATGPLPEADGARPRRPVRFSRRLRQLYPHAGGQVTTSRQGNLCRDEVGGCARRGDWC